MQPRRHSRQAGRLARLALLSTVASALAFAPAAPALAYFDNFLTSTIIGSMSQKESKSFAQSVGKALADTADGQSTTWTYPASGKRLPIDGTITLVDSKTDKDQPCRRVKTELRRGSAEETWNGWFCKQADGKWKSRRVGDE